MAVYKPPKPYATLNEYYVTKTSAGVYTVTGSASYSYDVFDNIQNGSADSSAQLGDVSGDQYHVHTHNTAVAGGHAIFTATFVGDTQSKGGFIGTTAGNYYLYTNNTYSNGDVVDTGPGNFALCFASGTLIRTARGDVPVEALAIGDRVITASGKHRPITWIGHREVDCTAAAVPSEDWPVRIRAGAFGIGACGNVLPERDLFLSPGHPVLVGEGGDERLVPIMCLINGTTIDREPVPSITYWHVELDGHDILLAEGLPAESFLDYGTRAWFGPDAEAHALANPDFVVPGLGARCRPVAIDGPLVEAERRRLDAVFATSLAAASAWPDESRWHIAV